MYVGSIARTVGTICLSAELHRIAFDTSGFATKPSIVYTGSKFRTYHLPDLCTVLPIGFIEESGFQ
jgi:hypothetical protein